MNCRKIALAPTAAVSLVAAVLLLGLAAQALALPTFYASEYGIGPCDKCHSMASVHAVSGHASQTCIVCHSVGTADAPLPAACAACHGKGTILADAPHRAQGCASTPGCHGAIGPSPTPSPTSPGPGPTEGGWEGSGGFVPAWVNSTAVPVEYEGLFDIAADGGMPWGDAAVTGIDYALGSDSGFSPAWRAGDGFESYGSGARAAVHGIGVVTVSPGDGQKTVYLLFRANTIGFAPRDPVSPLYSTTVTLDTQGPSTFAPRPASCTVGTWATLSFLVVDSSPQAQVNIRLTRSGTLVRNINVGEKATGQLVTYRFKCYLAKGRYQFSVRAVDLAGNRQVRAGTSSLYVR